MPTVLGNMGIANKSMVASEQIIDEETHQSLEQGENGDGLVPAEERVGQEATQQAEQERGAHEIGDDIC